MIVRLVTQKCNNLASVLSLSLIKQDENNDNIVVKLMVIFCRALVNMRKSIILET